MTREEGGLFARLAAGLADADIASLRFDLRGHGESEGRQEDLTIAGILADIRAAAALVCSQVGTDRVALLGTSFSGGICGYYAARHRAELASLVMLNPLLNYRKRLIDDKPYWHNGRISEEAGRELLDQSYLAHSPIFKLGRPLLNEVFYLQPHTVLSDIQAPTLIVHGIRDTFVPVESSRSRESWQRMCLNGDSQSLVSSRSGVVWLAGARQGARHEGEEVPEVPSHGVRFAHRPGVPDTAQSLTPAARLRSSRWRSASSAGRGRSDCPTRSLSLRHR